MKRNMLIGVITAGVAIVGAAAYIVSSILEKRNKKIAEPARSNHLTDVFSKAKQIAVN